MVMREGKIEKEIPITYFAVSIIQPPLYIEQRGHSSNAHDIHANHQIQSCQKLINRLPEYYYFHKSFNKQNKYQIRSIGLFGSIEGNSK
jgi:hypothetical protein